MFRLLHTADIHLDSPLKRLKAHEEAPVEDSKLRSQVQELLRAQLLRHGERQ
jgi:hypothetical protein